jgi:hypothetical protein
MSSGKVFDNIGIYVGLKGKKFISAFLISIFSAFLNPWDQDTRCGIQFVYIAWKTRFQAIIL